MKNKEDEDICVCNSTGEFVDWLLDTIRDRLYKCSKNKDFKGMGQLNDLYDDIIAKLEQE